MQSLLAYQPLPDKIYELATFLLTLSKVYVSRSFSLRTDKFLLKVERDLGSQISNSMQ